jgi:hypothetical protein
MRAFLSDFTLPDNEFFKVFGQPPKRSNVIEWRDDIRGDALDNEQQLLVGRYYEYNVMCRIGGEKPMAYEDWLEFDKRYQEHVRTAPSPLAPHTFQKISEVNQEKPIAADLQAEVQRLGKKLLETESARDGLREANSALAVKCQELIDTYEEQKVSLWKKIGDLRSELTQVTSERDDLVFDLDTKTTLITLLREEVCTLRARKDEIINELEKAILAKTQSYSDEDYQGLLEVRDELARENEEILKELETLKSGIGQRTTPTNQPLYPHYYRDVSQLTHIDVYWVLQAWSVNNPSVQHAVKKLLAAGQRGAKDTLQDLKEARNSINRAIELEETK